MQSPNALRDPLAILVVGGALGALLALVALLMLAWENLGSRNLGVATGALFGALILYLVQVPFELRPVVNRDLIGAEYAVDRSAQPSIRETADYRSPDEKQLQNRLTSIRLGTELQANQWLIQHNVGAFNGDRGKLASDFAIFSFLAFMVAAEPDWQVKASEYAGATLRFAALQPVSHSRQCTNLSDADLQSLLSRSGSVFAGAPILMSRGGLCLPPGTTLLISDRSLTLTNPVYRIELTTGSSSMVLYQHPVTLEAPPQLPGGEARFESHILAIDIVTTYFGLRAQNRDSAKYRDGLVG